MPKLDVHVEMTVYKVLRCFPLHSRSQHSGKHHYVSGSPLVSVNSSPLPLNVEGLRFSKQPVLIRCYASRELLRFTNGA
jgi:hypothetical protein